MNLLLVLVEHLVLMVNHQLPLDLLQQVDYMDNHQVLKKQEMVVLQVVRLLSTVHQQERLMVETTLEEVQRDKEINLDQMEKQVQLVNLVKKQEHYMLVVAALADTIIQHLELLLLVELVAKAAAELAEKYMNLPQIRVEMELLILAAAAAELVVLVEQVEQEL